MEERDDCLTLIIFLMSCNCECSMALIHSAVGVLMVFPDHTHSLTFLIVKYTCFQWVYQHKFHRAVPSDTSNKVRFKS